MTAKKFILTQVENSPRTLPDLVNLARREKHLTEIETRRAAQNLLEQGKLLLDAGMRLRPAEEETTS